MSKYIDAEKLIAEIERQIEKLNIQRQKSRRPQFTLYGEIIGLEQTLNLVRSLQQEQPEVDVVSTAKVFLDALSKTPYNNKPITDAQIIVRQLLLFFENPKEYNPDAILEQPEVDLNEEIDRFLKSEESTTYENAGSYKVAVKDMKKIARHFYELGLNARKEEKK